MKSTVEVGVSQNTESTAMADNKESAKIVLGPVIGKVTENSARILLELDSDAEVQSSL